MRGLVPLRFDSVREGEHLRVHVEVAGMAGPEALRLYVVSHHYRSEVDFAEADLERSAEAAARQGRFWDLHDLLFTRQDELEYEDLVKAGVIDPAKVTRSALQNAASIAALFLTTEAVVADKPEKHAAPAGGGGEDFGGGF